MPYVDKSNLYKSQIFRWRRIKEKAIEYKGGCCQECEHVGHSATYDFHHVNPKEKDVSWTKLRLRAWDKITEELDKCLLLCANCHRLKHITSKYD